MINVLIIFLESITTWLCLHIVFGKKIEKKWMELAFLVVYTVLSVLCSYKILNKFFLIFIVIWTIAWSRKMFEQRLRNTVIKSIIAIIALGVIEVIVMFVLYSAIENISNALIKSLLMCMVSLYVALLLYYVFNVKKSNSTKIVISKSVILFTTIVFAFLIYIKIEFENQRKVNNIYFFFFVVLAIAFIYMFKEQKSIYELEKKNIKLQLQNMYGEAYEELLNMVRIRQHDFKNQLSAIHSMHIKANTLDELVDMQKEYVSILTEESKYDGILTGCNNPIIAGYIYNLCVKCLKENIKIDYDISVVTSDIDMKTKEVIEILGILLSNAVESYINRNEADMIVNLVIKETDDIFTIEVENKAEYMSYDEIENIFKLGYSTKGKNRGMGLYSVKNIVNKFQGRISVNNISKKDANWVKFSVVM